MKVVRRADGAGPLRRRRERAWPRPRPGRPAYRRRARHRVTRPSIEKAITPFVEAATRVGKASNVTPMRRSAKNTDLDTQAVRAWAESNGYEVSSRGRIKGEIIEAFTAANA
jgi:hypothetical protein